MVTSPLRRCAWVSTTRSWQQLCEGGLSNSNFKMQNSNSNSLGRAGESRCDIHSFTANNTVFEFCILNFDLRRRNPPMPVRHTLICVRDAKQRRFVEHPA